MLALRILREDRGWSQEALAKRVGMTQEAISRYETGVAKNPGLKHLNALAQALDVPLAYAGVLFQHFTVEIPKDETPRTP
jgi:transcriptional regulator with XRE-family HTH domain